MFYVFFNLFPWDLCSNPISFEKYTRKVVSLYLYVYENRLIPLNFFIRGLHMKCAFSTDAFECVHHTKWYHMFFSRALCIFIVSLAVALDIYVRILFWYLYNETSSKLSPSDCNKMHNIIHRLLMYAKSKRSLLRTERAPRTNKT